MNITDFTDKVLVEVPGCPIPTLEEAVERVIIDFYDQTHLWQVDLDPLEVIADEKKYQLSGAVGGMPWYGDSDYSEGDQVKGTVAAVDYLFECICAGQSDDTQDVGDAWAATTGYVVGDKIGVTSGGVEYLFECITAGNSGASEPTWPDDENEAVIDGTVAWQNKGYNYTEPTWDATLGNAVIDNEVVWENIGIPTVLPDNTEIVAILRVLKNGTPLTPETDYVATSTEIEFETAPNPTDEIEIKVAVKPRYGQSVIPDELYLDWLDVIVAGAAARLLGIPDRRWTDKNRQAEKAWEYRQGIGQARKKTIQSFTNRSLTVQPREFGF